MILVKDTDIAKKYRDRRTVNITIDELPKRPRFYFNNEKDMVKFVKKVDPEQAKEINQKIANNYHMYASWYTEEENIDE